MRTDMVEAIGNLWPLAFIIFLILCVVLLRRQLAGLLERLSKFQVRRGQTEISAEAYENKEAKTEKRPEFVSDEKPTEAIEQAPKPEPVTSDEWAREMIRAYISRDVKRGEDAFAEAQQAQTSALERLKNEALRLWLRYEYGDVSALPKLQDMAKQQELDAGVQYIVHKYVGYCYQSASAFDKAVEEFEIAARLSQTEAERAGDVIEIAKCLYDMKQQPEALKKIMHEIGSVTQADALSILYQGLASLYEQAKDHEFRAIALEKALEIKPNSPDLRFYAAYSYGQKGFHPLSLFHYKTLLRFKPDYRMALNNMGVEYQALNMPIKSTNSFKEAIELNETLAMANLAKRYLNAGFEEEATHILDKAKTDKEPHPNVGEAMSAISERKETESQLMESELSVANEQQRYILGFADAYFSEQPHCPGFAGSWRASDGIEMEITQHDSEIEAFWTSDNNKHKMTGKVINRGATITIHKEKYVWSSPNKYEFVIDRTGYAYLAPDGQTLLIMAMKEGKHTFTELVKAD